MNDGTRWNPFTMSNVHQVRENVLGSVPRASG